MSRFVKERPLECTRCGAGLVDISAEDYLLLVDEYEGVWCVQCETRNNWRWRLAGLRIVADPVSTRSRRRTHASA